jgi:predicted aspartyl protease
VSSTAQGSYSALGEPLVPVVLKGRNGDDVEITALLDTGFNRGLLLFAHEARAANLPPSWSQSGESMRVADGRTVPIRTSFAWITWLGRTFETSVAVVNAERGESDRCLVGMELLRGTDILPREESFAVRAAAE